MDTFAVETTNAQMLDATLRQLPGGARVVEDSWDGTRCLVRVDGDPGFVRFAIEQQGYGKVIEIEPPRS